MVKLKNKKLILSVCLTLISLASFSQSPVLMPSFKYNSGIGVTTQDSTFSLNFRVRTQLRTSYNTNSLTDFSTSEIEARIRRMRLRFQGFVVNPKLNYYIQLSFSRGDMDWNDNESSSYNTSPNIARDVVVIYKANKNLSLLFGQTKLPGNRQRNVSSGELQFADRSIVNAKFNIDRDFGLQIAYKNKISTMAYALKGAVSSGEGRNSVISDAGLAYTARVELLPLGNFTNKGDFFEGDLEREKTPKVSLAAGYHFNENAKRIAGTTGKDLFEPRDIKAFIADLLVKYNGFALSSEYINRNTNNPITLNSSNDMSIVYVGEGKMMQLSYLFNNDVELATRYALISPYKSIQEHELQNQELGIGVTKYLRKHRVKLQGQLFNYHSKNLYTNTTAKNYINGMFQIELGI